MNKKKNVIVTGCCGFIGFSLSQKLLNNKNIQIIGLDTVNDYYDVNLKKQRLKLLKQNKNFQFKKVDIKKYDYLEKVFKKYKIDIIYNFAAQAGVQYSIKQFVNLTAKKLDMKIIWKGKGLNEKAFDKNNNPIIECDKNYFRPLDVNTLLGDSKKARKRLGWKPTKNINILIDEMIKSEYQYLNANK